MLSVIIITRNEAENIADCINSVAFADEVIVVDSGSQDETIAICRALNCKLVETDWPGFGPQKNRALALATQPWVLSLDADERVSDALKDEILATLQQNDAADGYQIPRLSSYCGHFVKCAGWYPDPVLRLFKRDSARFSNDLVHERVILDGKLGELQNPLIHYSFKNLEQVLGKVDHYSTLAAQSLYQRGKRATVTKAVLKGAFAFVRTYLLRGGFLEGQTGLMLSISNAEGTYYKYAKLALLCREVESPDQTPSDSSR